MRLAMKTRKKTMMTKMELGRVRIHLEATMVNLIKLKPKTTRITSCAFRRLIQQDSQKCMSNITLE